MTAPRNARFWVGPLLAFVLCLIAGAAVLVRIERAGTSHSVSSKAPAAASLRDGTCTASKQSYGVLEAAPGPTAKMVLSKTAAIEAVRTFDPNAAQKGTVDAYFAIVTFPGGGHNPTLGPSINQRPMWVGEISGLNYPMYSNKAMANPPPPVMFHHVIVYVDDATGAIGWEMMCQ